MDKDSMSASPLSEAHVVGVGTSIGLEIHLSLTLQEIGTNEGADLVRRRLGTLSSSAGPESSLCPFLHSLKWMKVLAVGMFWLAGLSATTGSETTVSLAAR